MGQENLCSQEKSSINKPIHRQPFKDSKIDALNGDKTEGYCTWGNLESQKTVLHASEGSIDSGFSHFTSRNVSDTCATPLEKDYSAINTVQKTKHAISRSKINKHQASQRSRVEINDWE